MGSVAFGAGRRIGSASLQGFPVDAGIEVLIRFFMAEGAGYFFQLFGMGKVFDRGIAMAIHAFGAVVDRSREFFGVDEERDRPSSPLGFQLWVGMAGFTVLVGLGPCGENAGEEENEDR